MMDDRTQRLGQHAANTSPAWAVAALGPVPADAAARQTWQTRAASLAAYREMYGYGHPDDPIGPEPSHQTPDQRAVWHQAFAALSSPTGPDVRTMPDGRLWLLRDTYDAETAWTPRHTGKELRLARLGAFDTGLGAIRAAAEAATAARRGDRGAAERHETLAASYRVLHEAYQQREHADGGPVEFDRVVPPSGDLQIAGKQFWLGPARAGTVIRFWADSDLVCMSAAATRIKALRSHLSRPTCAGSPPAVPFPPGRPTVLASDTTLTIEFPDGEIRAVPRTTTQPVRSIKGQRPRTAASNS